MGSFKKLTLIVMLAPFFSACTQGPPENTVEELIEAQYAQTDSLINEAVANAGNDKVQITMGTMMQSMLPRLERIENIHCNRTEGENNYTCTADITQTIVGKSQTNKTGFKVYKVKGEWVLSSG